MKIILVVCLSCISWFSFSQECNGFNLKNCDKSSFQGYTMNELSRNLKVSKGENVKINMEVKAGMDYYVSVCTDAFSNSSIIFQILTENNEIIFDNSMEKFISHFEFSVIESQELQIVVKVPDNIDTIKNECGNCLGIIIQNMVTPKLGF